jgi:hypothetical protein
MSRKLASAIVAAGLLGGLAGCDLGVRTEVSGSSAVIYGRVDTEAGVGVLGVQIRIGYSAADTCGTTVIQGVNGPTTDSTGSYGVPIIDGGAPRTVCVKVVATPPATLPLAPDSVRRNVQLTDPLAPDSVPIDFVLPPKSAAQGRGSAERLTNFRAPSVPSPRRAPRRSRM